MRQRCSIMLQLKVHEQVAQGAVDVAAVALQQRVLGRVHQVDGDPKKSIIF